MQQEQTDVLETVFLATVCVANAFHQFLVVPQPFLKFVQVVRHQVVFCVATALERF